MLESAHHQVQQRSLPGYALEHPASKIRAALHRHVDGRLLSGCGGDLEVVHPLELERSQHTGLPVRVASIGVFGSSDVVKGIVKVEGTKHVVVHGDSLLAVVQDLEMVESSSLSGGRLLELPGRIVTVIAEKHSKSELLICILLDNGLYHYSFCAQTSQHFQCVQAFKCTRQITSGLLWRDGGLLHVAYYDGFVRVGIIHEEYDDMLLVKKISANKNNLLVLVNVVTEELERIEKIEAQEKARRVEMTDKSKEIMDKIGATEELDEANNTYSDFSQLKVSFKNHSIRCERVSQRLFCLRKLLVVINEAMEAEHFLESSIRALEDELEKLDSLRILCEECAETNNEELMSKSWIALEQRQFAVQDLLKKASQSNAARHTAEWEKNIDSIIEQLNGRADSPKDMRLTISQNIFEHRGDKKDIFTHFVLDTNARELTLYCLSGLTTLAVYPRKGKRIASISLDASYATKLTAACSMLSVEGVYVADDVNVFPIYFYREKRYLDAGNPLQVPAFDHITSLLVECDGMVLGSVTGGLLHISFDYASKYEHFIVASSVLAQPLSNGPMECVKILPAGDTTLVLHSTPTEVVVSERDHTDRWHRVTSHTGGAHSIVTTPFCLQQRGAFAVVASKTYVRIKALQYAEETLIGLHDLGESRVEDESGTQVEVLNVSLDPSMEFRQLPCKLRYAVGFSDKAIRTYVALLTGHHEFVVAEKFIAQIEPLYSVQQMVCFHGRPMGCYATCSKTLQVWNDLDRHQQKKLKSERMQLVKLNSAVSSIERAEAGSCYLLVGFQDDRVSVFEEKPRGSGTIELLGNVEPWHQGLGDRAVQCLRTRTTSSSIGDRLFIHSLTPSSIILHTVLIASSKIIHQQFVMAVEHSMCSARGFELLPFKHFEFVVFGNGASVERLSNEQKKIIDEFRDFEF
ncbi:unnamed protein product [Caenorhabditis auriculariae]|uniref:Uncharacterized protein n=1 Tax=Caenorhabditis auriculariae TaxID=2777116 RepID=A0A8S1H065_9PELO|nr:unnamed protein product [Caenorhabditis auriculariae]